MIENCTINKFLLELHHMSDDNISWKEIAKITNEKFNTNLSPNACRKRVSRLQKLLEQQDQVYIDLKKEDIKISDIQQLYNANIRTITREETLREIAHEFASTMQNKFMLTVDNKILPKNDFLFKKHALLLIGDWHYGLTIDNYFNVYNTNIAKLRIQQLQDKVINILQKECISKLTVLNLGDMISGYIHLPIRVSSRIDVITQTMEVSELIAEFLCNLSHYTTDLDYYSVLDNHSRLNYKKQDAIQLESLARITPWFLKERLINTDIKINDNEVDEDIATFKINDFNVLGVHGDKDSQKNIVPNLSTFTHEHYDIICSAHYHHFSANEDNDTLHISNGSLMGTDEFAFKLRKNSKPSQTLVVVSQNNPCEVLYKIVLD